MQQKGMGKIGKAKRGSKRTSRMPDPLILIPARPIVVVVVLPVRHPSPTHPVDHIHRGHLLDAPLAPLDHLHRAVAVGLRVRVRCVQVREPPRVLLLLRPLAVLRPHHLTHTHTRYIPSPIPAISPRPPRVDIVLVIVIHFHNRRRIRRRRERRERVRVRRVGRHDGGVARQRDPRRAPRRARGHSRQRVARAHALDVMLVPTPTPRPISIPIPIPTPMLIPIPIPILILIAVVVTATAQYS